MHGHDAGGSRRRFLSAVMGLPATAVIAAVGSAQAQPRMRPTPACGEPGGVTPPQTEGPYFKPRSPLRASLIEPGISGERIVVEGTVFAADCQAIPRALIDVWHADDRGRYDTDGYRCRGHQFTDDAGHYRIETVVPGAYPGRTRHVHVIVQAPGGRPLTTQLYFPGEAGNQRDGLFDPALLLKIRDGGAVKLAAFDFVLEAGAGRRS